MAKSGAPVGAHLCVRPNPGRQADLPPTALRDTLQSTELLRPAQTHSPPKQFVRSSLSSIFTGLLLLQSSARTSISASFIMSADISPL